MSHSLHQVTPTTILESRPSETLPPSAQHGFLDVLPPTNDYASPDTGERESDAVVKHSDSDFGPLDDAFYQRKRATLRWQHRAKNDKKQQEASDQKSEQTHEDQEGVKR